MLPLSARLSEIPFNTFTVYDATLATPEVFTGRLVLRETADVAHYGRIFDHFAERACTGDAATQLLTGWMESFRRCRTAS